MRRHLDVDWDDEKSDTLKKTRGHSLEEVAEIFTRSHLERTKNDDPIQGLATGFAKGKLVSVVFEIRETDDENSILWLVTWWNATTAERKAYEREIKG